MLSRGFLLFSHLFSVVASVIPSRYRPASPSALRVFILEILNSCSCHGINLGKALIAQAVNTPESILIRKTTQDRGKGAEDWKILLCLVDLHLVAITMGHNDFFPDIPVSPCISCKTNKQAQPTHKPLTKPTN